VKLSARPTFDGKADAKALYISAFASAQFSAVIAPSDEIIQKIEEKFGREETETFLRDYDIARSLEALTEREASYILKFRSLDAIRTRAASQGISGRHRLPQRGLWDQGIKDDDIEISDTETVKFSPKFKKPGQLELPIFSQQQHEIEFGEKALKVELEKPAAKPAPKPKKKVVKKAKPKAVKSDQGLQGRTQKIRMASTGWIGSAGRVVRNVDEAASLVSPIRKSAQELAYVILTDKSGLVQEIHKYSKGLKLWAPISCGEFEAHIFRIDGAPRAHHVCARYRPL